MTDEHPTGPDTDNERAAGPVLPWMLIPLIPSIVFVVYFLVTGKITA